MKSVTAALFACVLTATAGTAWADWPEKPIKVIVPYNAGGGSDVGVRILQKAIAEQGLLSQPLVPVNVGGAGGRTGSRQVLEADPDGYTFLSNHMTLMTSEATGLADFGHRDFEPVASTGSVCMVVAVPEDSPYQTLDDLMEASAESPGSIVYGANLGALNHMAGISLEETLPGAKFRFAQIGGDTENYVAVKGEVVPVAGMSTGQYKSGLGGGVRALAVLAPERNPQLPDVPTAREQGFDTTFCFDYWWFAPEGTPDEAVSGLADALETAMQAPEVKAAFEERAMIPLFQRGEELRKHLATEWERIERIAPKALTK